MKVFTIDGRDYRLPNSLNDRSLHAYHDLIDHNLKCSVFTSTDVLAAAGACADAELNRWIAWYQTRYNIH